ncbi:MAG TPA: S1/P1 Nuclease [Caulobacteraceae bacterium]|jgi:hypothetical protein|nr:S1/P1 Nuclease [Caulobacteraceae bacterium]
MRLGGRHFEAVLAAAAIVAAPHAVGAWGATGHRIIGALAVESLPADLPPFLRTRGAAEAAGELAREPDRWKGSGRTHDADRDPGHFLDLGDDGRVMGGPALAALPTTREGYDSDLRAIGADSWRAGYLPYSIIDGWQQLAKDFAYWRVAAAAAVSVADPAHRAWLGADAARREALILRDLGVLGHYVGDGSQPLHVTSHFNGWGPGPNPDDFTLDRIHAPFEGALVRRYMSEAEVRADMAPYRDCACSIERRTVRYLAATSREVTPLYRLWKAGAFVGGEAAGRAFTAHRLAAGADELRDMIIDAWRASAAGEVGYPPVRVADVIAGKIDPTDSLYGLD